MADLSTDAASALAFAEGSADTGGEPAVEMQPQLPIDVASRISTPAPAALPCFTEGLALRSSGDDEFDGAEPDFDPWATMPIMGMSASTPAFGSMEARGSPPRTAPARPQLQGQRTSPLRARPALTGVKVDRWGFPVATTRYPAHSQDWNSNHHLTGSENEIKPTRLRQYFSAPESEDTLKRTLSESRRRSAKSLLRALDGPTAQPPKRPFVTADVGAPLVPERHVVGGSMKDRDGKGRTWNERWHTGISLLNDRCHPDHRAYFTQKSLFEESPSQNWRRFLDQEVDRGVWTPIATRRKPRFPPLGGRLTGRSGAPVPSP